MSNLEKDILLLKEYLKDLKHWYYDVIPKVDTCDFITREKILSSPMPSEKEIVRKLTGYAERLLSKANECKSIERSHRLLKYSELLQKPDFRSKRAACLVDRRKSLINMRLKRFEDGIKAEEIRLRRVAIIVKENNEDWSLFINPNEDIYELNQEKFNSMVETLNKVLAKLERKYESENHNTSEPTDLIDLEKAITIFQISRTQIKRNIYKGKIKTYRKIDKGKHIVSESELSKVHTRRKIISKP